MGGTGEPRLPPDLQAGRHTAHHPRRDNPEAIYQTMKATNWGFPVQPARTWPPVAFSPAATHPAESSARPQKVGRSGGVCQTFILSSLEAQQQHHLSRHEEDGSSKHRAALCHVRQHQVVVLRRGSDGTRTAGFLLQTPKVTSKSSVLLESRWFSCSDPL